MKGKRLLKAAAVFTAVAMFISGTAFSFAEGDSTATVVPESSNKSEITLTDDAPGEDVALSEEDEPMLIDGEGAQLIDNEPVAIPTNFDVYKDTKGHWAEATLKTAYEDGLIQGFEDGTMRPDAIITPAQMITIITRIVNTENRTSLDGMGIDSDCWYKDALAAALSMGFIQKSDISKMNSPMNRKEAGIMMAKAFDIDSADADLANASKYSDFGNLSTKEKQVYASLVNNKYMEGWGGALQLTSSITRAEFVTILYRVLKDYVDADSDGSIGQIASPSIISGDKISLINENINSNIWADAKVKDIELENSHLKNLVIMSDEINSLNITNTSIERLVLGASSGNLSIEGQNIDTVAVANGGGTVKINPKGNNVDVTGDRRTVDISGNVKKLSVSGDVNTISLSSVANAETVVINGNNNVIEINSKVKNLVIRGKNNTIKGGGSADKATVYNKSNTLGISVADKVDKSDNGITGMSLEISTKLVVDAGSYINATLNLVNGPEEAKPVTVTWYFDNQLVYTENLNATSASHPTLTYYVNYSTGSPYGATLYSKVEYIFEDGTKQTVTSAPAYLTINRSTPAPKATITTYYKGNYTTQWAIDHNISNADKEAFVNSQGYSSTSKYLIWVNIGTQYTSVFQGSKGNWKLIRSGLVSTGAKDNTPRGVFKTTYKQSNWTTSTYTVKPIVRFYGGGFAFHSRLYKPNTTVLQAGSNNAVGYPLSHGCVRMQADDIQWLYDNVPNGTTVVVY